jgi:hypothetical protein
MGGIIWRRLARIDFRRNSQNVPPNIRTVSRKNTHTAVIKRAEVVEQLGNAYWEQLRQAGHGLRLHAITLALRTTPEQVEVVSLLPRIHLAIFHASALRVDLAEMLVQIKDRKHAVLITGPSHTADIEKTLAIGVHGPKMLHVWSYEG